MIKMLYIFRYETVYETFPPEIDEANKRSD